MDMEWTTRARKLGNEVLQELGLAAYAVIGEIGEFQEFTSTGGWLNPLGARDRGLFKSSRSPIVAPWKAGELNACNFATDQGLRQTPIFTEPEMRGTGWRGGVQIGTRIIAVSGLPQHHDELIAAIMHMTAVTPDFKLGLGAALPQPADRGGRSAGLVHIKSSDPAGFIATLHKICQGSEIEEGSRDDGDRNSHSIWVTKEGDDDREPAAIGVLSSLWI